MFAYVQFLLYLCNQFAKMMDKSRFIEIFDSIRDSGFSAHTLQLIDNYVNDILYGRANIHRFNLQ